MSTINCENLLSTILENQHTLYNQNREIIFANVFHDTIKGSKWFPSDFPLSPGRGALGYPALYVLYRVLNEFHPQNILEMGMGQSTKVIGLYNNYYPECRHQVVEHDPEWISFFCNHFDLPSTTKVVELPLMNADIQLDEISSNTIMYNGFPQAFEGQVFDFICIDGPYGFNNPQYSRIDIIGILPECLTKSFVIILDDCDRKGEQNTFNMICDILKEHNIEHNSSIYYGEKGTGIIVSPDYSFMCSM